MAAARRGSGAWSPGRPAWTASPDQLRTPGGLLAGAGDVAGAAAAGLVDAFRSELQHPVGQRSGDSDHDGSSRRALMDGRHPMDAEAADGRLGFMMPTGYEHPMMAWADNRKVICAD